MSSITLKITSLVVRTLSKPIANQIKAQAREHSRFRKLCVSFAQSLHRVDMRLRLGLLRDNASIERQSAKEAAEAQAKKHRHETSSGTGKTTEEGGSIAQRVKEKEKEKEKETPKEKEKSKPRIRPLSEAKAIDTGATFISETFLFLVAGSLIVFESLRSRRKETTRREDVADRLGELEESERNARRALVALEHEVMRLRAANHLGPGNSTTEAGKKSLPSSRILPKEVWELEEEEEAEEEARKSSIVSRWWSSLSSWSGLPNVDSGDSSVSTSSSSSSSSDSSAPSTSSPSSSSSLPSKPPRTDGARS